ncbi:MAG: sigma-54 dependent transcriptional regulator [Steroidobacteraceae bacterium]
MNGPKVLIVEDDAPLREALADTLAAAGIDGEAVADAGGALSRLEAGDIGLVISDVHMPRIDGIELLASIKRRWRDLPVVLMTAHATVARAVAAMREGATDYIVKPFDAAQLVELTRRLLASRAAPEDLVAEDPETQRVLALAARIAATDATVLLTGPSGTGKEVFARFIRSRSSRAGAPFVAINCAAIPDNMLEATLFGHEKGAFTGALAAHAGKFEQAQGGTLLLDEISEMDSSLQAKILRVLQEREVERVGGSRSIALDVRVIATSNRDLAEEVRAGRFRGDLYYRLNVMTLELPALARRQGDILPLAARALAACGRGHLRFSADARAALLAHDWPGNVRELNNTVQRAALLCGGGVIDTALLGLAPAPAAAGVAMPGSPPTVYAAADSSLDEDLRARECQRIFDTLRATAGSRKLAAQRLGISPRTLRHKLQQLKAAGIRIPGRGELLGSLA